MLSYPFIARDLFDRLGYAADDSRRRTVAVANPMSDEAPLMRTSVLDSLLGHAPPQHRARQQGRGGLRAGAGDGRPGGRAERPVPGIESRPDDEMLAAILGAVPAQPRHVAFAAAGEAEPGGPWGPAWALRRR